MLLRQRLLLGYYEGSFGESFRSISRGAGVLVEPRGLLQPLLLQDLAPRPVWKSKFYGAFASESATPSMRRLLDGVAMPVPHR